MPGVRWTSEFGVASVFGRHFVGSEAGIERIHLFLCLDLPVPGGNILAGEDRLAGGDIGLTVDADAEKETQWDQRRLGDGGGQTQCPKIVAKLFIAASLVTALFAPLPRVAATIMYLPDVIARRGDQCVNQVTSAKFWRLSN